MFFFFGKKMQRETTKVVNVKVTNIRPEGYQNLKEWCDDPDNVYIGRKGIVFVDSTRFPKKDSIWANPFKISVEHDRKSVIKKYEKYIRKKLDRDEISLEDLKRLKGKNLGCWCYPEKCHGDVLVKLIDELIDGTESGEVQEDEIESFLDSKTLEELKIIKKRVESKIKTLSPLKPLNYARVKQNLHVPNDFCYRADWERKVCFDLATRLKGTTEDFRLFFLELVDDVPETNIKAARAFDKAYRGLEAKLLDNAEKKIRKTLPKSKIKVVYNSDTDRYESKYA